MIVRAGTDPAGVLEFYIFHPRIHAYVHLKSWKNTNQAVNRNYLWERRLHKERGNFYFLSYISVYSLHFFASTDCANNFSKDGFHLKKKKSILTATASAEEPTKSEAPAQAEA